MTTLVRRSLVWLRYIENGLLTALVLLLVVLAGAQIILRDLFHSGLGFADPLMRQLVLWTGMLGALAAVRDDKHIALDVLQRFLNPAAQKAARVLTFGFAATICAVMAYYGYAMVQLDYESGTPSNAFASLPAWMTEIILPVAFGLMALRFALRAFAPPAHPHALLHDPGKAQA
jgi:TRAP-type C4-dicarboxylate transport system permease small subunit